jgi:1A family penicillin-binding protein
VKYIKFFISLIFIFVTIFIILNCAVFYYAKLQAKPLLKNANSLIYYDHLNESFFKGKGGQEWVNIKDISPYVIDAFLAVEDKRFYAHRGIDYIRLFKVILTNITNISAATGTSTITQQYARNLFVNFDRTWERKLREAWLAIQIEAHYSKEEILEGYLNTINYGHGVYGIGNASQFYFDKKPSELTLAEAAILAAIPKAPSFYSPLINETAARSRQRLIISTMEKLNYITPLEAKLALSEELVYVGKKNQLSLDTLMYFQDAVTEELYNINTIPDALINTGGLKIYTTLDLEIQKAFEESMDHYLQKNPEIQAAGIFLDPNTGEVKALIGGRDYSKSEFNRAIHAKRQVGSTMKAFLYYAALENGFTASTTFTSEPTTFNLGPKQTYSPKNYAERYPYRQIPLALALPLSDNIYAVKTHLFLGEEVLVNTTKRLGIKSELEPIPSLPLGTCELSVLEMITAYSTFANGGYRIEPYFIRKVEDMYGNVLYKRKEQEKLQILNPGITFILNELLSGTFDYRLNDYTVPTGIGIASKLTRKYAAKSGSTNTDNWMIGYNPELIGAVWVGHDYYDAEQTTNFSYARNIWADTIEKTLSDKPEVWYDIPQNVVGVLINPINGKVATENSKVKKIIYYIKGTEPTSASPDEIVSKDFN